MIIYVKIYYFKIKVTFPRWYTSDCKNSKSSDFTGLFLLKLSLILWIQVYLETSPKF